MTNQNCSKTIKFAEIKFVGTRIAVCMQTRAGFWTQAHTTPHIVHKHKSVMKNWREGERIEEKKKKQPSNTNAAAVTLVKPMDTGKSEKVGAYDTEIYTWSGVNGATATFWVAKDSQI